ncbi:hypothetical protein [Rhizobium sp. BK661]|uniref:hypothetical protein n=1 Tax=Rhizobium sp. BK661 TaxID=2586991 RepID=UPI00216A05BE|nr:hypothetical protein [Rhizobium sp. BK661]MCS3743635.1 hypothetical protein [Rhizobium sp. BK661]
MEDENMETEMVRRVMAHARSTIQVIDSKKRLSRCDGALLSFPAALADEQTTRKELISWQAPTAPLAVRKLLHLLAHVLAAELSFDEQSLAEIAAETRRLESDSRASSPDLPDDQVLASNGSCNGLDESKSTSEDD